MNITAEYLWDLLEKQNNRCALSGVEINFSKTEAEYRKIGMTASVDRIDSSKGYIKENVQLVHKDLNLLKSDLSQEKFFELCKMVASQESVKYIPGLMSQVI